MLRPRTKTFLLVGLALGLAQILSGFVSPSLASALSGSDFNASRIIDDSIFFNPQGMTAQEIQEFLNAKVPSCDTNGQQTVYDSAYGDTVTRAVYSQRRGVDPPFTCLKDYVQNIPGIVADSFCTGSVGAGTKSAATIIKEVAVACNISPQVILVTLQKEQSLITDDWPWPIQYTKATGMGCPDTPLGTDVDQNQNGCYDEYEGFFKQIYYGARQFQRYVKQPDVFNYALGRTSYVAYQANNPGCGGTNIAPESQATAALYNYTPYQPNAAALNNLYGTGDACSAYGNRNFWRMFNEWFGPTTNSEDYWLLVRHPVDGRYFIATNFAVHYVPSQQAMDDWGIGNLQPITVPTNYITSRTYGSPLNRLLRDKFGNIFLMDGGKRHYVRDTRYLSLWQQDINSAITVHGLSTYVADGDWLGYCAKSLTTPTNVWLMNGNKRHAINDTSLQSTWGCDGPQTTRLTDNLVSTFPDGGAASRSAVSSTGKKFVADQGRLFTNNDQQIVEFYIPAGQVSITLDTRLEQLFGVQNLTLFAQNISNGQWFYIENGNRHYITSLKIAELWGFNGLTSLSNSLLTGFTAGFNLPSAARTISPDKYYVLSGSSKNYLPSAASIAEWLPSGAPIEIMPNNVLNRYTDAATLNSPVGRNDSGDYFITQNGNRIAFTNYNLVDAWTLPSLPFTPISNKLYNYLNPIGAMPYTVKDGTNYYYLEGGIKYSVPSSLSNSWSLSQSLSVLPATLARYTLDARIMAPYVRYGGKTFSLNSLVKTELSSSLLAVVPPSQIAILQKNYFPENNFKTSHVLRSTNGSDTRLWLVSTTGKILLPTTAHAFNYGYVSRSVILTLLAPESLDAIPTLPDNLSFIVQSPGGAFKLVSFGEGLGMPNGDVVNAYSTITGSVTQVSQEVFDIFHFSRYASRLIRDDSGKVYWLENGQKRWILNGGLLNTTFNGIPQTYLHSTVTTLIPDGSTMN